MLDSFFFLVSRHYPKDLWIRPCAFVCSSVRPWRDIWRFAHQIFLKLGTKLHLGETKKCSKRIFEKNSRLRPGGVLASKPPFLAENGLLSLYLRNRASDFDDFFTDVRYFCF